MVYQLSSALFGHSLDVRALATTHDGCIISTSRDKTAKIWKPNGFNSGFTEKASLLGHTSFVSCVCVLPSTPDFPEGLILTGGCDKKICAFHPKGFNLLFTLEDHKDNVCCLSPGQGAFVLSSSWDKSAKLWHVGEQRCVLTLTGHELTVWSVLQLPSTGVIATGSADRTVRIYGPDGGYLRTLNGHTDCVRALAAESPVELLSCANDATIRKWNVNTGECLDVFYGHKHYIYTLVISDGLIVSGGEDRTVRVWSGKHSEQIMLPAQSVWAVAKLPNGDIVTGTNDGVVRVFSQDPGRQADSDTIATYQQDITNLDKADEQEIGGVKISDLPGREALYEPGRTDGQTKMIREGGAVTCYSWSAAAGEWTKIGDVMGAQATAGKTLHNGKEYDYVFSVDIEDGMPPLKLPYNKGEDPWVAAQQFIHRNDLSQHFLETVANFIVTNSRDSEPILPATGAVDPFTGGTRYVPVGGSAGGVTGVDPFTGGTRYIPGTPAASVGGPVPGADPFTGGTRYVPNGAPVSKPTAESGLFPQTSYVRFDQGNLQPILDKLQELNAGTTVSVNVSPSAIEEMVKLANLGAVDNPAAIDTLTQLLAWPPVCVFPVLDVLRLALRNAAVNNRLCEDDRLVSVMEQHLTPTSPPNNQMLALRVVCNMMSQPRGEALVVEKRHFLLAMCRQLASGKATKNLQIALTTLLLNLSVAVIRKNDVSCQHEAVATLSLILPWLPEPEALLRGLVALGTLLSHNATLCSEVSRETLERLRSVDPTHAKLSACSRHILTLLNSQ